jgi:GTPase SAR1 family protein
MVDNIEEEGASTSRARQKVVFVGDVSVGKTSIINRFIDNKFRDTYEVIKLLIITSFSI